MYLNPKKSLTKGITLVELLIVITILAVMLIILYLLSLTQIGRSRDAVRKADLERIKIAFEDYYNDNNCYPDSDVLLECRGTSFQPYLPLIPCDPMTDQPYFYVPLEEDQCGGYRVYTSLEDTTDPQIAEFGCDGPLGCGVGSTFTYGIASGVPIFHSSFDFSTLPTPIPSPVVSPSPVSSPVPTSSPVPPASPLPPTHVFACDTGGFCNEYEVNSPFLLTCPHTYEHSDCDNDCANLSNRCAG